MLDCWEDPETGVGELRLACATSQTEGAGRKGTAGLQVQGRGINWDPDTVY